MGDNTKSLFVAGQKGKMRIGDELYKPVSRRSYEVTFYERVQDPNDELHVFKPYIPIYKGMRKVTGEDGVETDFLVMNDLLAPYSKPGCMDIKVGLPHDPVLRANLTCTGVANLLGCFVHGVDTEKMVHLNRVEGYLGREVSVGLFQNIMKTFFETMGNAPQLQNSVTQLRKILEGFPGYLFDSTSLFFIYEQDSSSSVPPSMYLIDFERVRITSAPEPDFPVITSLNHVVNKMQIAWETRRRTVVYLIAEGEETKGDEAVISKNISERLGYTHAHIISCAHSKKSLENVVPLAKKLAVKIHVERGLTHPGEKNGVETILSENSEIFDLKNWDITENLSERQTIINKLIRAHDESREANCNQNEEERSDLIIFAPLDVVQAAMDSLVSERTKLVPDSISVLVRDVTDKNLWEILSLNELGHLKVV